jgi:hypothetical protein
MARLSETDKVQLRRPIKPATPKATPLPQVSARAFAEFATFASHFNRARKPVRFEGRQWRL